MFPSDTLRRLIHNQGQRNAGEQRCFGEEPPRMSYTITSPCIDTMDQSCVDVCPVDCIHYEEGVDKILYIDPDECIDCGACEPACPVSAIYAEDDVPEEEEMYKEINVLWFQDKDAARAKVPE